MQREPLFFEARLIFVICQYFFFPFCSCLLLRDANLRPRKRSSNFGRWHGNSVLSQCFGELGLIASLILFVFESRQVVRPIVHYLDAHGYKVVVASRTLEKAQNLVKGASNAVAVECDVETEAGLKKLEDLIPTAHAVISLLPYLLHSLVAKRALAHNKHFLTTSYVR